MPRASLRAGTITLTSGPVGGGGLVLRRGARPPLVEGEGRGAGPERGRDPGGEEHVVAHAHEVSGSPRAQTRHARVGERRRHHPGGRPRQRAWGAPSSCCQLGGRPLLQHVDRHRGRGAARRRGRGARPRGRRGRGGAAAAGGRARSWSTRATTRASRRRCGPGSSAMPARADAAAGPARRPARELRFDAIRAVVAAQAARRRADPARGLRRAGVAPGRARPRGLARGRGAARRLAARGR